MYLGILYLFTVAAAQNPAERKEKRDVADYAKRWIMPIPFYIESGFSIDNRKDIFTAIHYIEEHTCVSFQQQIGRRNAVPITPNGTCSSKSLGMQLPPMYYRHLAVSLNPKEGCLETIGVPLHEFFHLLGLIHTHERPDADKYVTIDYSNLEESKRLQFGEESIRNLVPYDYSSIMHYGSHLSRDSSSRRPDEPTVIAKDKRFTHTMGNQKEATFYDLHAINQFYDCYQWCKNPPNCQNGGMVNPANCSTCNCPSGYGGDLCDKKPFNCGRTLLATTDYQYDTLVIGHILNKRNYEYHYCSTWIQAPNDDYFIELEILELKIAGLRRLNIQERASCRVNGIEVKIGVDKKLGGAVFCDYEDIRQNFTSAYSTLPIILFNREGIQEYKIRYRAIDKLTWFERGLGYFASFLGLN